MQKQHTITAHDFGQTLDEIESLLHAVDALAASTPGFVPPMVPPPEQDRFITDDESEAFPILIRAARRKVEAIHHARGRQ